MTQDDLRPACRCQTAPHQWYRKSKHFIEMSDETMAYEKPDFGSEVSSEMSEQALSSQVFRCVSDFEGTSPMLVNGETDVGLGWLVRRTDGRNALE